MEHGQFSNDVRFMLRTISSLAMKPGWWAHEEVRPGASAAPGRAHCRMRPPRGAGARPGRGSDAARGVTAVRVMSGRGARRRRPAVSRASPLPHAALKRRHARRASSTRPAVCSSPSPPGCTERA